MSQSGSMCASSSQFLRSQLPLPIQDSRWRACPFAHSCCSSICFALCVTIPENLFTPPFLSIIWDLFSLCSRCYSQNAKSEIEEVTHVICLAMVCLDAALSAMKTAYTPSFLSHKTKTSNSRKTFLCKCLHADSSHCIVDMYFNVYMYICKSIFINIIVLEPAFLVLVNDRLVLGEWLRVVNQCCLTTQSHCNLSYMLLGSSNNLQDTYMQYLYILHL